MTTTTHPSVHIQKSHVWITLCDSLQFYRVGVVMRAVLHADQDDGDIGPRLPEEFELELVHVVGLTV